VLRNPLLDDVFVHGTQLLPNARLYFAPQAYFALAWSDWPAHGIPGFRLVRVRGRRFNVYGLSALHFLRPGMHRLQRSRIGVTPKSLATNAWFSRWFQPRELFWNYVCAAAF
jgi:hypothetical protein